MKDREREMSKYIQGAQLSFSVNNRRRARACVCVSGFSSHMHTAGHWNALSTDVRSVQNAEQVACRILSSAPD